MSVELPLGEPGVEHDSNPASTQISSNQAATIDGSPDASADPDLLRLFERWRQSNASGEQTNLDDLCRDRPDLLERLRDLIASASRSGLLDSSAQTVDSVAAKPAAAANAFPEIPGYRILGKLGEGGMGVVYKAEQIALGRIVALKMILKGGELHSNERARFMTEAEAVARLQHTNIVQLFELGEYKGLPYFTLEYMPGGSLRDRLAQGPIAEREAASLAEQIARGIHKAHQCNIVHRDLKPANILIAEDGTPKVSDFGLAKKTELQEGMTQSGSVLGTPSYMAPEQAGGDTKHVGPAADIYAIGAILFDCLAGRPPFRGPSVMDTLMQVIHEEPPPLRRLQPNVSVDLETICAKCLQKDPAKRYESAEALAEDLARFLRGEPIIARPIGAIERLWRWCRRNPRIAALSGVLCLVIVTSVCVLAWMYALAESSRLRAIADREFAEDQQRLALEQKRRAEQARAKALEQSRLASRLATLAKLEADKSKQVADFLVGMFESSDPFGLEDSVLGFQTGNKNMTAEQILARGVEMLDRLDSQPLVQAAVLDTIGGVYVNLGEYDRATQLLLKSHKLHKEHFEEDPNGYAENCHQLGWLYQNRGMYLKARRFYAESLQTFRRHAGEASPRVTDVLFKTAFLDAMVGRSEEAERGFTEVLRRRRKEHGTDKHRTVAIAQFALAAVAIDRGDLLRAVPSAMAGAKTMIELEGDEGIGAAASHFQRAMLSAYLWNRPRAAEQELKKCIEVLKKRLGPDHIYVAGALYQLGDVIDSQGGARHKEALELYLRSLAILRKTVGLGFPQASLGVYRVALHLEREGKQAESDRIFAELLQAQARRYGAEHPIVAESKVLYAEILSGRGDYARASSLAKSAWDSIVTGEARFGYRSQLHSWCRRILLKAYSRTGNYAALVELCEQPEFCCGSTPKAVFDAAAICADVRTAINSSTVLDSETKRKLAERCLARVSGLLETAIERGFRDRLALLINPDLGSLRTHPAVSRVVDRLPPLPKNIVHVFSGRMGRTTAKLSPSGKYERVHSINLAKGKSYQIDLSSPDFDTYLIVQNKSGSVKLVNDDISRVRDNLNSRLLVRPARTEEYRIIVTSFARRATGRYSVVVRER